MELTRRDWIKGASLAPVMVNVVGSAQAATPPTALTYPVRSAFAATETTYLDNGSQHPISLGARAAVDAYLDNRMLKPEDKSFALDEDGLKTKFAKLINADASEISYVQSTTAGEQAVIRALGLPDSGGHVVTDTLHFFGSLPLYLDLGKRGVDVSWVKADQGRIRLDAIRAALRKGTKLVALSHVSTINGFEHDLHAVCELCHAHGALVYADIVHAAGCVPIDVKATGVDFAATATYKWLMGDFGLGFLYVRKDLLPQLRRENWGYYGLSDLKTHIYPLDPPGDIAEYAFQDDVTGAFAIGTHAHTVIAQLHHSLDWIAALGIDAMGRHRLELVRHLREGLRKRGYALQTPEESRTPLITATLADARNKLAAPMRAAKVRLTLSTNRFRLTPSIQNDHRDVERFLAVLPPADKA